MGNAQFLDEGDLLVVFDLEIAEQKRMIKPVGLFQLMKTPGRSWATGIRYSVLFLLSIMKTILSHWRITYNSFNPLKE